MQDKIREAIFEGQFKPGQRLVERPLCEQLGVSRTVIREAIRYLEAEGLVTNLQNKGPIVATMDWKQALQIYEIRKMLETSAAVACAEQATVELQQRLKVALKKLELAYGTNTSGALLKATTEFYRIIFAEAGHLVAWEIVQRLNGRISWLRLMTLSTADRHQSGFFHIARIYDAIVSKNPKATRAAVYAHLEEASSIAERLLNTTNSVNTGDI